MSKRTEKTDDIISESIYELVKKGYGEYQQYINDGRYIPGVDGFKRVYRRYLVSTKERARGSLTSTNSVLSHAMENYHPHEVQPEVLYRLVNDGLVIGQGNFGSDRLYRKMGGAAPRYTEVRYNKALDNILFKFEDYFIMQDGEVSDKKEPQFLIMPVPYALLRGTIGTGAGGVRTKIPAFTYESILDAYKNDNPQLLKSAYGLDIDYERSNLDKVWNKGFGKIVFKFNVEKNSDGSVTLSGDATNANPTIDLLKKWAADDLMTITDLSVKTMKLNFSRNNNIRKISDKDIYNEVMKASVIDDVRSIYYIMFSHKGTAIKMGIKGWLDLTMGLYRSTFERWKLSEVEKMKYNIEKLKLIPKVAEMIRANKTTQAIATEINKSKKYVSSIESLPLKMLRKTDFESQINKILDNIKLIEATDVDQLITSGKLIDNL